MSIWRVWLRSAEGRKEQRKWKSDYEAHKRTVWISRITLETLKVLNKHIQMTNAFNGAYDPLFAAQSNRP